MPLSISVRKIAVPEKLDLENRSVFLRQGQLILAQGEVLRIEAFGADRISELAAKWKELVASTAIDNQVGLPGSGMIGLTSITFSEHSSAPSVLYVPKTAIVIRGENAFEISADAE